MNLPNSVLWTLDGVVEPKVASAKEVAGPAPYNFLHFWPCIMVRGPVEERKKNPESVAGVHQLARGLIFPAISNI